MRKKIYQPPYSIQELKGKFPDKIDTLLKDPAHVWRATTGIELIHLEPSKKEQLRIWENWKQMPKELRAKSDLKSIELFGVANKDHHQLLLQKWGE